MSDIRSRSWFCVWNNPDRIIVYKHSEDGTVLTDDLGKKIVLSDVPDPFFADMSEEEICKKVLNIWTSSRQGRTGAVVFCKSADGLRHLHIVFESKNACSFSVIKKLFPKAHIEPTQGTKQDVENYISKVGKFEEKGELILARSQVGDIVGCQGKRSDLISFQEIFDMIHIENMTPNDIFDKYPQALKSQGIVEKIYFRKRVKETDLIRNVHVTWYCGATGCGKTYNYVRLCEVYGEDNVYMVSDYNAPFDNYLGQDIIFFDEFRGQIPLPTLLICLQGYKQEIHARYYNKVALWTKVYISSPVTPYEVYLQHKDTNGKNDKLQQLYRRITDIVFCSKLDTPSSSYYFQTRFDCELDGSADDLYCMFQAELSAYKGFISLGQAQNISDCVYIQNNAID